MKKIFSERKYGIVRAVLFMLMITVLLTLHRQWLVSDEVNFATGENRWNLDGDYERNTVCQIFRPYGTGELKKIGIVVTAPEDSMQGGFLTITLTEKGEDEAFSIIQIPYEEIQLDRYTEIDVSQQVSQWKEYELRIKLDKTENGTQPQLQACNKEDGISENRTLYFGENKETGQLLLLYEYENILNRMKVVHIVILCLLIAFFIAFPFPDKKWIRNIVGILVLMTIPYLLGRRLELLSAIQIVLLPNAMKWNIGMMYGLEIILLLCFGSILTTAIVTDVFLTVLYTANYYVYSFRGEPIRISDISAAGTAAQVMGGYDYTPNDHLIFAWGIAILLGVIAWRCRIPHIKKTVITPKKLILRGSGIIAAVLTAIVSYHMFVDTDLLVKHGFENVTGFHRNMTYLQNGYLVATCLDLQDMKDIEYADYSAERAQELQEEYQKTNTPITDDMPNVIMIMNESFTDLRVLGNLEISEENLGFIYGLKKNTIHGYANVSTWGGGTCKTEFEALTGNTMAFFPQSYYPYMQGIKGPTESLVTVMQANGYKTYSMHPERRQNWNRDKVYKYLNFDQSLWKEDFTGARYLHHGVADVETYKKIEELYEQKAAGERIFVFDLTMQNHSGYSREADNETAYSIHAVNASDAEADLFLSLIKESDDAFSQLVNYFEQQDEKVIICMFGDHHPQIENEDFYNTIYDQTEGMTEEEFQFNKYKTPFVIWANYEIEEQEGMDISSNYLGALLLKTAGIPGNAYFNYLEQLMEEYPVITINGYRDSEGNVYSWSGQGDEFPDYRTLQYKYMFDK